MNHTDDHDATLDRILHGIANAEPHTGFAQRLAANVQATLVERKARSSRWRTAWIALPAMALPVLALLFLAHAHRIDAPASPANSATMKAISPSLAPAAVPTAPVETSHLRFEAAARGTVAQQTRREALSPDELAALQMRAPSLPELPLQPTTDDRMLERAVEHGADPSLAELALPARDAALARERREYQKFFQPRPLLIVPPPPAPFELSSQPNLPGDPIHAAND